MQSFCSQTNGSQQNLQNRRLTSHCCYGLWNRNHPESGQNFRPRQSVCHGSQTVGCIGKRGHRHARRTKWSCSYCWWQLPTRICSSRPSQSGRTRTRQSGLLITPHAEIIQPVQIEIDRQLATLPRKDIAEKSLANSQIILVKIWQKQSKSPTNMLRNIWLLPHAIQERLLTKFNMQAQSFRSLQYRKCRRLCIRHQSYPADQRLCQSLQWSVFR